MRPLEIFLFLYGILIGKRFPISFIDISIDEMKNIALIFEQNSGMLYIRKPNFSCIFRKFLTYISKF